MERITGTCPGCRKRCDLATPRCHVGEAYARTGMLPGDKKKDKKEHPKADPVRMTEGGRQNDMASEDGRLADTLRAVSRALRHGEGTLDALSAEEKAQLGALIEKAWEGMESGHHGHHHGHHDHHEHHGHHVHEGHHGHKEHLVHDGHNGHKEHLVHDGHHGHEEHHDHHGHHGHDEHHDHHGHHGHEEQHRHNDQHDQHDPDGNNGGPCNCKDKHHDGD